MKNLLILISCIMFCLSTYAQDQTLKGKVTASDDGTSLSGATVQIKGTSISTTTGVDGNFSLNIPASVVESSKNITIEVFSVGMETGEFKVSFPLDESYTFSLNISDMDIDEVVVVGYGVSPMSDWFGAEISYNLIGENEITNFVGSAQVKMGEIDLDIDKWDFMVLGNISNIGTETNDDIEKNANKLAQSTQGISLSLAPIFTSKEWEIGNNNAEVILRYFGELGVKYNAIKLDSVKEVTYDKETVQFPQFGFSLGAELEGITLKNDDKPFNLSARFYSNFFDRENFAIVYDKEVGVIYGLNASLVVPIPGPPLGFKVNYNLSNVFEGYFSIGFLIKN